MRFLLASKQGLVDGSITLTFRNWSRPQAKVGGRYRMFEIMLEVTDVRVVAARTITDKQARRAGEASAATIVDRLGVTPDAPVYRVEFRYAGPDDRIARRNDDAVDDVRRADLDKRLDRLDKASPIGPWTRQTLALISRRPAVVSTVLAAELGQDRPAFKINVRKLKELGLTQSLEVGYRLSPLGERYLAARAVTGTRPTNR